MSPLPSPVALQSMQHLLCYRFLTVPQLVRLGVSKSKRYIQDELNPIIKIKAPLVAFQGYSKNPGKLDHLYWLTDKGNKLMAEAQAIEQGQLPYLKLTPPMPPAKNPDGIPRDYFHRVIFIDCQIALLAALTAAGLSLTFFHSYFDPLNPPKAAHERALRQRNLPFFVFDVFELKPDGLFLAFDASGSAIFCALELHRFHDTGRIHSQLVTHALAITDGIVGRSYNLEFPHRVLTVLDNPGMAGRVAKRIADDPLFSELNEHFWFADLDALKTNFATAWIDIAGKPRQLF